MLINLVRLDFQVFNQKIGQTHGHASPHLQANDVAEPSLINVITNRRQQIIGLVFFDLTVGVAGNTELSRGVYFVAREKLTHAAVDQVFNQHDIDFAIGGIKTQLGVNVFLTLGQIEESRNIIRALHTGVANVTFILLAYQFDNEIDARI